MAFFDDFTNAVSNYPATNVTMTIVDVAAHPPAVGPAINVNEVFRFQVRVRNNGPLNMTGVSLHIEGQHGAQVSTNADGPFSSAIIFGNLAVHALGQQDTANLFFKAPSATRPAGTALVRAHISTWNANLNYQLNDKSGHADPPSGTYSNQVFPA